MQGHGPSLAGSPLSPFAHIPLRKGTITRKHEAYNVDNYQGKGIVYTGSMGPANRRLRVRFMLPLRRIDIVLYGYAVTVGHSATQEVRSVLAFLRKCSQPFRLCPFLSISFTGRFCDCRKDVYVLRCSEQIVGDRHCILLPERQRGK